MERLLRPGAAYRVKLSLLREKKQGEEKGGWQQWRV